jgi:hypothetical protein
MKNFPKNFVNENLKGSFFSQKFFCVIYGIVPPKTTFCHIVRGDTGGGGVGPHARGGV